jgi:hypothetical protein
MTSSRRDRTVTRDLAALRASQMDGSPVAVGAADGSERSYRGSCRLLTMNSDERAAVALCLQRACSSLPKGQPGAGLQPSSGLLSFS